MGIRCPEGVFNVRLWIKLGRICQGERRGHISAMTSSPPPVRLSIGHVHLKVSDLSRATTFYHDVLGLDITQRYGSQAVFLSSDGYHHHIGLNTWESLGGPPSPEGCAGLYHVAFVYSTRGELAQAVRRVLAAGVVLEGAVDHGVSLAVYFRDPDQNGVELYWDRPRADWPKDSQGGLSMVTDALDLPALLQDG